MPSNGLFAPCLQVAQLSFGGSPSGPRRVAGNTSLSGSRYSVLRFLTSRIPYHAVTRCGVLSDHCPNSRVLWQKVQFTPSPFDIDIIREYVSSVVWIDEPMPAAGSALVA